MKRPASLSLAARLPFVIAAALVALLAITDQRSVEAEYPFAATNGDVSDPYAYWDYMYIEPGQFPPSDLGDDEWKYTSKTACDLYPPPHANAVNCDPLVINNPQELTVSPALPSTSPGRRRPAARTSSSPCTTPASAGTTTAR